MASSNALMPSRVLPPAVPYGFGSSALVLGPDGQPARLSDSQRTDEMLGAYDAYQAAAFVFPPYNPDIFISTKGFKALDDMQNVGVLKSALNTLRDALLYKGWKWTPQIDGKPADPNDPDYALAQRFADKLQWCCNHIEDDAGNCQDFRDVLYQLAYAIHTGFRLTEIVWKQLDSAPSGMKGKLGFKVFADKPCQQIGFQLDLRTLSVLSITSYSPLQGYQFGLPVEKVLRYTFAPEANLPYGRGTGRPTYKHTWSIDALIKFWNIGCEVFGTPFILGTAAPGKSMELARKAIAQIRQGAPAVLPTGVTAELIEIAGTGLAAFNLAIRWHAEQIALAYLGNTLTSGTTSEGTNTNALGNVHQDQQAYGFAGRRRDLEFVASAQLARRWVRYNYGADAQRFAPGLSLGDWDSADMGAVVTAAKGLVNMGSAHESEPWIRQMAGAPPIDPQFQKLLDDKRKQAAEQEAAKQQTKSPANHAGGDDSDKENDPDDGTSD